MCNFNALRFKIFTAATYGIFHRHRPADYNSSLYQVASS